MTTLRNLISKLDSQTNVSLEKAVGFCAAQGHYHVEIEHWLLQFFEQTNSDFMAALAHFSIDQQQLKHDIMRVLADFKTGNSRTPALSPDLVTWIQQAWTTTSLELQQDLITLNILLYMLLTYEPLSRQVVNLSPEFKKISPADLRDTFLTIAPKRSEGAAANPIPTSQKALQQFTINLTQEALQGKIDPVIGRDAEIRQMIDILLRRRQNNPILTGEAGVGKTAVVEGLALRIAKHDVPDELKDVQIHTLDLALLQAGASVKGEFENRLKSVIAEVKHSLKPIILFVDEAHNLIGAGNQAGQGDAANLLKPALARGELRTIAATTWSEYKKFFEKDAALTRRFQVVTVEEPTEDVAVAIMRGMLSTLESHHKVRILDEALLAAVRLSKRYLPSRQLPDKAISLLDTACANVRLSQTATPAAIEDTQRELEKIAGCIALLTREHGTGIQHQEKLKALNNQNKEIKKRLAALETAWEKEKDSIHNIIELQKKLENTEATALSAKARKQLVTELVHHKNTLYANEENLMHPEVNEQTIARVLGNWTGIPVGKMLSSEVDNLLNLEKELQKRVIGQDHAIKTVAQNVITARAHLSDPRKPLGVFLLLGSSGIGKTETALALADALYGGRQNLTVINMSEFKEEHKISMLTGSPAGYVGYGEGGLLTEAVRRKPYSVILLDEIEKAHRGIQDIFYQVFDKGMLFDGEGREVDFKNTIILMTSNVGSETIISAGGKQLSELKERLQPDLLKVFKPAFLSRVTLVPYLPLDTSSLTNIIKQQLMRIEQRMNQQYGATFKYEKKLLDYIMQNCQQVEGGARNIENIIANQLLPSLSTALLEKVAKSEKVKSAHIDLTDNQRFIIHLS